MIKLWTLLPGGSPNIYLPSSLLVVRRRWLWWGLRYTKGSLVACALSLLHPASSPILLTSLITAASQSPQLCFSPPPQPLLLLSCLSHCPFPKVTHPLCPWEGSNRGDGGGSSTAGSSLPLAVLCSKDSPGTPPMTFTTNDIPSFSSCLQCCPWRGSEGGNGSFPALAVAIMRLSAGFSPTPVALPPALLHIEVLLRRAVVGQAVSVTVLHKYRQIFSVEGVLQVWRENILSGPNLLI